MNKLIMVSVVSLMSLTVGCANNAHPVLQPPVAAHTVVVVPPAAIQPSHQEEVPCGHSLTVKLGKLDVDLPKGGTLDIAGIKGETQQYHIVLEGVEFSTREYCK